MDKINFFSYQFACLCEQQLAVRRSSGSLLSSRDSALYYNQSSVYHESCTLMPTWTRPA